MPSLSQSVPVVCFRCRRRIRIFPGQPRLCVLCKELLEGEQRPFGAGVQLSLDWFAEQTVTKTVTRHPVARHLEPPRWTNPRQIARRRQIRRRYRRPLPRWYWPH